MHANCQSFLLVHIVGLCDGRFIPCLYFFDFTAGQASELEVLDTVDSDLLSHQLDEQISSESSKISIPEGNEEVGQVAIEELKHEVELSQVVFIGVVVTVIFQVDHVKHHSFENLLVGDHEEGGDCSRSHQQQFESDREASSEQRIVFEGLLSLVKVQLPETEGNLGANN